MNIFIRSFLIVVGIILAAFALWGADEMKYNYPTALIVLGFIATVVGACACYNFIKNYVDSISYSETYSLDDMMDVLCFTDDALYAAIILVCSAFLFGWLAEDWTSPSISLLVIGAIPSVLVVKSIVTDIVLSRYEKMINGE